MRLSVLDTDYSLGGASSPKRIIPSPIDRITLRGNGLGESGTWPDTTSTTPPASLIPHLRQHRQDHPRLRLVGPDSLADQHRLRRRDQERARSPTDCASELLRETMTDRDFALRWAHTRAHDLDAHGASENLALVGRHMRQCILLTKSEAMRIARIRRLVEPRRER